FQRSHARHVAERGACRCGCEYGRQTCVDGGGSGHCTRCAAASRARFSARGTAGFVVGARSESGRAGGTGARCVHEQGRGQAMKFFDDLRSLDRNNIGGWPTSVKGFFVAIIVIVILFLGWYFYISGQQDTLASGQQKEVTLRHEFEDKQAQVVNLDALKAQLAQMNEMLSQMLRELPSKTEMPALLVN